jgi:hypothetical protein
MSAKKFRFYLTGIVLLSFLAANAQDYAETALLFTRNKPSGSARILGLGGAQTALGGDYSSALSNPAGLGMYNRSEFTFSLGLADHKTSANYLGTHTDENRSVFNIPGFSYVWNLPPRNPDGPYVGGSFGISFSRTNDFNRETIYKGDNQNNSIIDYFIDQAWGETTDQFFDNGRHVNTPTGLAYFNYLIGARSILPDPGPSDEYFTDADYPYQNEEIIVKGATNQFNFSYGGNLKDMFFFGGGIGISKIRYDSRKVFNEQFADGPLIEMQLMEDLGISGTGVNATFGAIVRPVNYLQLGVSYTTPTFYQMSETYDASMWSRWDNYDYDGDGTKILPDTSNNPEFIDQIISEYNFTSPSRLRGGATFISKFGFITADVEVTNPSKAKYKSRESFISFQPENESIRERYQSVINFRLGAEYRHDIWRVRAGYGMLSNTYNDSFDVDNAITTVSGGVGIRMQTFYVDLAVISSSTNRYDYRPYTFFDGSGPVAEFKDRSLNGVITVGSTF